MTSIKEDRPLFPNPLDEPLFYRRYFRKWVGNALAEREVETDIYSNIMKKTLNPGGD